MDRRLRAARDGGIVVALTVGAVIWQGGKDAQEKLVPADITLTAPTVPGTEQLQLLVRGAGCDQPKALRKRGYRDPHDRVKRTHTQFDDNARTITVTIQVEPPGVYACGDVDPGVPWTIWLPAPVGDRRILDGTKNPPVPIRSGPARTLPLGTILTPTAGPTGAPGGAPAARPTGTSPPA